jgi:hypothetical protein
MRLSYPVGFVSRQLPVGTTAALATHEHSDDQRDNLTMNSHENVFPFDDAPTLDWGNREKPFMSEDSFLDFDINADWPEISGLDWLFSSQFH